MTRLTALSLANRAVVLLVSAILLGLGAVSMATLKQELIPSIDTPGATVVTVQPGAGPEAVEREVSRPLEDAVAAVGGVTRVTSRSASAVSTVRVEWAFGTDSDKVLADVRAAIDTTGTRLPAGVEPRVVAGRFDDVPIVVLAVASPEPTAVLSRKLTEIVVAKLTTLPGVRDVLVAGEEVRQVVVTLRPADVERLGVETAGLAQVFAANGIAVPAGSLPVGGTTVDVEVGRTLGSVEDIAAIQVQGTDGPVALSAIADVALAPVETTSISRANGTPSLTVAVVKEASGNTVSVSRAVRAELPALIERVGGGATVSTVFDQAPYIEDSIKDLSVEGGLGLFFAVVVILVFLVSLRSTVITAISIPLSLLIAMIGLRAGGYTLNILTLGALTVAIGRVVDDSIVVIENIKRHQGLGDTGPAAIVRSVREVAGAVTSSTLTTVAVFLPIGLVSGQTGELFRPFAVTVTIALLASLLVSLTVVPVLASWFMRRAGSGAPGAPPAAARVGGAAAYEAGMPPPTTSVTRLQRSYLPALRWALGHRALTLALAFLVFAGTLALAPRLKTDFLGNAGASTLRVVQKLPPGTALALTDAAAVRVEQVVARQPEVVSYTTTVGGDPSRLFFGGVSGPNDASLSVTLRSGAEGSVVADRLRRELAEVADIGTVEVVATQANSDIALVVEGPDLEALRRGSAQVAALLASIPGMRNVSTDLTAAKAMLKVGVDAVAAAKAGMAQAQIGQAVAQAVKGSTVGTVTLADDTVDVVLRSRAPVRTVEELRALPLPVTPKQTVDVRTSAADAVSDRQKAAQRKAQAEQDAALADQIAQLRESRSKAQSGVDGLVAQIATLQRQLAQLAALPPGAAPPAAAPDPAATIRAQIAQLERSLESARTSLRATDDGLRKALNTRSTTRTARAEADSIAQAAEDARSAKATPVLLDDVADIREVASPASIGRVDGVRAATVTGTPAAGDVGGVTSTIRAKLADLDLPEGVSVRIAGVSQAQQESFAQLGLAMLVAIAIVYLVMVATFRSLLQPLILLVSVPFAATGALGLLLLTGTPLGIPAMIGLLMLIGIVVTNAIVLIDLINQFRENGAGVRESILDGARLRLRPIVMTALATIFALLPMALGVTGGGVFISTPLALVVIGGLVSSTVLTLVLVPVLYDLAERARERLRRRVGARSTEGAQAGDPPEPGAAGGPPESAEGPGRPAPVPAGTT